MENLLVVNGIIFNLWNSVNLSRPRWLRSQSGPEQATEFVEGLKRAGVFKDRKDYTRLKQRIARASTSTKFVESDELIKELDDDIINCCAYG